MISHPMGKAWHERLQAGDHEMVPHALPDEATLGHLCRDLPLRLRQFVDDRDLYMALLQVPLHSPTCRSSCEQKMHDMMHLSHTRPIIDADACPIACLLCGSELLLSM